MKKINILLIITAIFLISGCQDTEEEIAEYTKNDIVKMDKVLSLLNNQAKYPKQGEFSLLSAIEYKKIKVMPSGRENLPSDNQNSSSLPEESVFYSPLGIISPSFKYSGKKEDVVLVKFQHSNWVYDHKETVINICNYTLKKLNKEMKLYGFNINNDYIEKRTDKGMNDPVNFDNACKTYVYSPENIFYLAFIVK